MSTPVWNPSQIEPDTLRRRLAALPTSPGVYMYKNTAGDILSLGKAINLR
jgi:excinuclease UvrABC nuclease subunit